VNGAFPFDRKESGMPKAQHFASRFSSKIASKIPPRSPRSANRTRRRRVGINESVITAVLPPLARDRAKYLEKFFPSPGEAHLIARKDAIST